MPLDLATAGALLYGERWQAPMARALGVSRTTVLNWHAGRYPVPDDAMDRLREMLADRHDALVDILYRS